MDHKALADLIARSKEFVSFGSQENGPDPSMIAMAEASLGRELPASYKWFLRSYGGGTVYGDEIFSVYPVSAVSPTGDVVRNSLSFAASGWIESGEIAVCMTDYGELYVIGTEKEGEDYPVHLYLDASKTRFANSFAGFLGKFVESP